MILSLGYCFPAISYHYQGRDWYAIPDVSTCTGEKVLGYVLTGELERILSGKDRVWVPVEHLGKQYQLNSDSGVRPGECPIEVARTTRVRRVSDAFHCSTLTVVWSTIASSWAQYCKWRLPGAVQP